MRTIMARALLGLLAGCATVPTEDEARLWVERLSPSCESRGFEEWTPAWTECIRTSYMLRSREQMQTFTPALESPAYTHTYCAPSHGDKYNCISF